MSISIYHNKYFWYFSSKNQWFLLICLIILTFYHIFAIFSNLEDKPLAYDFTDSLLFHLSRGQWWFLTCHQIWFITASFKVLPNPAPLCGKHKHIFNYFSTHWQLSRPAHLLPLWKVAMLLPIPPASRMLQPGIGAPVRYFGNSRFITGITHYIKVKGAGELNIWEGESGNKSNSN